MGYIENRLNQLGIVLPKKDRHGKGTVPAKEAGGLLYISAQLPIDESGPPLYIGRVGTEVSLEDAYAAARMCGLNALRCVADYVGDLDRVECVVKILGLVNSGGDFSNQPAVINGFSDLMVEIFGDRGLHARSAMGAYVLPMNVPVTVDCIFKLR